MESWIVIPARRGEKNKNTWKIAGFTLVEWLLKQTENLGMDRLVSTDSPEVAEMAYKHELVRVVDRPPELSQGKTGQLAKAVLHALDSVFAEPDDIVHLCQPTSPFVMPVHIECADIELRKEHHIASVQTIIEVPHNFHEHNQRYRFREYVGFVHEEARRKEGTKQEKPPRWAFGNLVSTRVKELRYSEWFFGQPSRAIPIDRYTSLDIDDSRDLVIAEAYVACGLVSNPWGTL